MAYATVEELQQFVSIDRPTELQQEGLQRCLDEAAAEIEGELGLDSPALGPPPHPIVVGVNLRRATEHWKSSYSPHGVIGISPETEPIVIARNTWYRHKLALQPLKTRHGVA